MTGRIVRIIQIILLVFIVVLTALYAKSGSENNTGCDSGSSPSEYLKNYFDKKIVLEKSPISIDSSEVVISQFFRFPYRMKIIKSSLPPKIAFLLVTIEVLGKL